MKPNPTLLDPIKLNPWIDPNRVYLGSAWLEIHVYRLSLCVADRWTELSRSLRTSGV